MKPDRRGELPAGYVSGPEAATQATVMALARAAGARAVVLVEGISDRSRLKRWLAAAAGASARKASRSSRPAARTRSPVT